MGKIVATYHVKVTLREPDESDGPAAVKAVEQPAQPPTIATVEEGVAALFSIGGLVANATAERTDK
jgi:hypothetical protein